MKVHEDEDRLIGYRGIAEIYDVEVSTARQWYRRKDSRLPAPAIDRPGFRRWRRRDVLARIEKLGAGLKVAG